MTEYFTGANTSWRRAKLELDLDNYGAKVDLKNGVDIDTSQFPK